MNTPFAFPLRLCAFALCLFDCRLCRTLPTLCRFSAISFTPKTPLSSTKTPVSITNHPHSSNTASPSTTRNSALFTRQLKSDCRFAENKTRQIGNLNTVNKTPISGNNSSLNFSKIHKRPFLYCVLDNTVRYTVYLCCVTHSTECDTAYGSKKRK